MITIVVLIVKAYSFDVGESSSESEIGGSRIMKNISQATTGPYYPPRPVHHDLISLVEKGKVGMSSNSSCCSSTTSSIGDRHGILAATKIVSEQNDTTQQR